MIHMATHIFSQHPHNHTHTAYYSGYPDTFNVVFSLVILAWRGNATTTTPRLQSEPTRPVYAMTNG